MLLGCRGVVALKCRMTEGPLSHREVNSPCANLGEECSSSGEQPAPRPKVARLGNSREIHVTTVHKTGWRGVGGGGDQRGD